MEVLTESPTDPVTTFITAYQKAGTALLNDCLLGLASKRPEALDNVKEAAEKLMNMDVPYSYMIHFESSVAAWMPRMNAKRQEMSAEILPSSKIDVWYGVMGAYATSGFRVSEEVLQVASRRIGQDAAGIKSALVPNGVNSKNELLKPVGPDHASRTEVLWFKINSREALKRHGGNKPWNNLLIGMYKRKLAKLQTSDQ